VATVHFLSNGIIHVIHVCYINERSKVHESLNRENFGFIHAKTIKKYLYIYKTKAFYK
jgi:hypothetical protein